MVRKNLGVHILLDYCALTFIPLNKASHHTNQCTEKHPRETSPQTWLPAFVDPATSRIIWAAVNWGPRMLLARIVVLMLQGARIVIKPAISLHSMKSFTF